MDTALHAECKEDTQVVAGCCPTLDELGSQNQVEVYNFLGTFSITLETRLHNCLSCHLPALASLSYNH